MPEINYVSLKKLALDLGMDRSHARRYVLGLGYRPVKRRTLDSGNQAALALTEDEAKNIMRRRQEAGFLSEGQVIKEDHGFFYAIQLVPELDPKRLKLGFAVNVNERLAQHRTSAPTAVCLKKWPCRRTWEIAAMDCLTRKACTLIASEVFECADLNALIETGEQFFKMMPTVVSAGAIMR